MNVSTYIPLFIDVSSLNVLVIGGGKVGTKRALNFASHGAKVTVVSLSFSDELLKNKDKIELIQKDAKELDENFFSGYDIIIVATNDKKLNLEICNKVKELRKLCNNPTQPETSNFIVPIYYSDDKLSIAITTFGKSSLTAKYILDLIKEEVLTSNIYNLVESMSKVKELLKEKISDPSIRFNFYNKIFNDELFRTYVNNGNLDLALKRAMVIINGE